MTSGLAAVVANVLAAHYPNSYAERAGGVGGCRCGDASGTRTEHVAHVAAEVTNALTTALASPEVVEAAARAAWPYVDGVALTTMARGLAAIPEALGASEVDRG